MVGTLASTAYGPKTSARRAVARKLYYCLEAGATPRCRGYIAPGDMYDRVTIFPGHEYMPAADGGTHWVIYCMGCADYFGKP